VNEQTEIKNFKAREAELKENYWQPLVQEVDDLVNEISDVKKQLEQFRADRKVDDLSLYSEIDDILEKHKIYRSAHHSGMINGVGVGILPYARYKAQIRRFPILYFQTSTLRNSLSGAHNSAKSV